ncbi:signal peptidase I [Enterococcus plantarum]|uniref:signal peptidase I n=1 Tax=Enterococcus TaxID=1350 RepID=UPI001A8E5F45|nr:signal peptidase I [Enterococcus plantarum]MBO0423284.1 signal peptidase I [Enterococcus plantarum]
MGKKNKVIKKDLILFLSVLIVIIFSRMFLLSNIIVHGESMNPSLEDKERIFGLKIGEIERFDIISFKAPTESGDPEKNYIKRVIALPGETITYADDSLYINGEKITEPFLGELKQALPSNELLTEDNFTYSVPENHYFVMGDNRRNSTDSRVIGSISEDKIIGNAKFSYWPINKIGTVR